MEILRSGGAFVAVPAMGHSDVRGSRLMPRVVTPAFALEDKLPVAPGGFELNFHSVSGMSHDDASKRSAIDHC